MSQTLSFSMLTGLDVFVTATSLLVQAGLLPCPSGRAMLLLS
jgi:hypothetical protein